MRLLFYRSGDEDALMGIKMSRQLCIPVGQIHFSEKNCKRLERDRKEIEVVRRRIEEGLDILPLDVIQREDGDYDIEDGRHRFLAFERAGFTYVSCRIL